MTLLFVCGINDANEVRPSFKQSKLTFGINGTSNVSQRLGYAENEFDLLTLMGANASQPSIRLPARPSLVFNEISDPDTHQGALKRCIELCDKVGSPTINHPRQILMNTRDHVARVLQGIPNVIMPRTIRCAPSGPDAIFSEINRLDLKLPVIVRIAGDHGGKNSVLVRGPEDYRCLHVYPFDGRDFYLTEFVDYRGEDGYYTKFRIVVVDSVPLIRHQLTNDGWMVHGSSREFMQNKPELEKRQLSLFKTFNDDLRPRIQPAITEISKRLQLDYYGIDCHISESGEMLIFEANANMNILFYKDGDLDSQRQVEQIKRHIKQLLYKRKLN